MQEIHNSCCLHLLISFRRRLRERTGLYKETKAAVVEGSKGKVCTVDYTLTAKGQQVAVVEQILVFEHEGYIWTVRYTYRQDDETAKEVTDYIFKRFGNQY